MPISLQTFTVGPLQENCYLLFDEDTKQAVLVDPGEEAPRLLKALKNLTLTAIWLTHSHFDHIGAIADIQDVLGNIPVYLHPEDKIIFNNSYKAAQLWEIPFRQPQTETQDLSDRQILKLNDTEVYCLFTPGHAPGHIAFYIPDSNFVLSGDALFKGGIGRTDFVMGNHQQLLESIRTKLFTLPDDTVVYSGHGPKTTIGFEKQTNPFLI
jgi:glyoxylase-like metal-dependent hydrolase (beta-lactamase superfamily II)